MALVANNLYTLDVHSPKKDIVLTVGPAVPAALVVSIHLGSAINVRKEVSLTSTIEQCLRLALSEMPNIVATAHCVVGGKPELDGIPGTDEVTLSIGATVVAKQQTHFIHRTTTRLTEFITEGR